MGGNRAYIFSKFILFPVSQEGGAQYSVAAPPTYSVIRLVCSTLHPVSSADQWITTNTTKWLRSQKCVIRSFRSMKRWIINTIPDYTMTYWWQERKTHDLTGKTFKWLVRCLWLWKNMIISILTILVVLKQVLPCAEWLNEDRQVLETQLSNHPSAPRYLPKTDMVPLSIYLLMKCLHVHLHMLSNPVCELLVIAIQEQKIETAWPFTAKRVHHEQD